MEILKLNFDIWHGTFPDNFTYCLSFKLLFPDSDNTGITKELWFDFLTREEQLNWPV